MSEETLPTRLDRVGARKRRKQRSALMFVRDILIIFLVAVLVSFLIKTFLVRSFYIPSGSMENTLLIKDRILVNELEPRLIPVHHGDVVVFTDPGGWLPAQPQTAAPNPVAQAIDGALSLVGLSASDSDDHLIKRVIGLPGDRVQCCNALGQLMVNGVPLKEPYTIVPSGKDAATLAVRRHRPRRSPLGDGRQPVQLPGLEPQPEPARQGVRAHVGRRRPRLRHHLADQPLGLARRLPRRVPGRGAARQVIRATW